MSNNPFDDDRLCGARSAMVRMIPDEQGRFEFELWCQYTRKGLHSFQIGDLVGVESYTPPENGSPVYSVLTLTQVYPIHFAAQGNDAYPGHIFESMRSIKDDWEKQSDRPLHPTTTIIAHAVSTGLQFKYNPVDKELPTPENERDLPMVGSEVRPLSMEMVDAIINRDMEKQPDSPFSHKKFDDVNIKLDKGALLTTHFGIFGFTGVGKSNLVSSMVTAIGSRSNNSELDLSDKATNVVLIDPNDEYVGLLIDKFISNPKEMNYINVGTDTLPAPIIEDLGQGKDPSADNVELFIQQMKLPARLKDKKELQEYIRKGAKNALIRTNIVLPAKSLGSWIRNQLQEQMEKGTGAAVREVIYVVEIQWATPYDQTPITKEAVEEAINLATKMNSIVTDAPTLDPKKSGTAKGVVERTTRALKRLKQNLDKVPSKAIISINDIINVLNNKGAHQTLIVTAHHDSDLKQFVEILGNELYESRRQKGLLKPFTVFIFDEADLFIPTESVDKETDLIKELCITLARRGRKFGLGIGISTQRASLLDTEVMGNLHTYFVSKLPRAGDRQRIAEAFGIGEDQLAPTFTFRPGDWLIISHDATGLKGVPIPSYANDANERIIQAAGERKQ